MYGTQLTLADAYPQDMSPWEVETIEEAVSRVHNFFETDNFRLERPSPEAEEAIAELSIKRDLIVITGRDEIVESFTRAWTQEHFKGIFQAVHFTAFYSLTGKKRSKAEVALASGAGYHIDDHLETAQEVAHAGMESILFGNYPWNQADELPAGVTRCNDWPAVLEYFDGRG
jgi:hypothetical protein